jgi:hypothetical protein
MLDADDLRLDDEGALDLIPGLGALDERIARFVSSKKDKPRQRGCPQEDN